MAFLNHNSTILSISSKTDAGIKTLTMESLVKIIFLFLKWYFLNLAFKKKLPKQQHRWPHLPRLQSAHVTALVSAPGQSPAGQQLREMESYSQLPLLTKLFWIFLCWGRMIMPRKTKVLDNGTQLKTPSIMQCNAHLHPSLPRWCFNQQVCDLSFLSSPPLVDVSHQCWGREKRGKASLQVTS